MGERFRQLLQWPGPADPIIYTVILIAYFLPWIDHPTAGLTLIGLDVSEWAKFLPQMQSGELPSRDFLYLPPIFLGGSLAATALLSPIAKLFHWRFLTIAAVAFAIGLLAFPSFDAIRFEAADQWRPRLVWIGLLGGWAGLLIPLMQRMMAKRTNKLVGLGVQFLLGPAGVVLPALVLLPTRRVAAEWLNVDLTVGFGFWLSTLGFAALTLVTACRLWMAIKKKAAVRPL